MRASTTEVALSGVTPIVRISSIGLGETSWIESTAPSDETQRRGRRRRRSALRAHSMDGIGATSTSPARSFFASSTGTPWTSWTSASSRWKTGAMFTYEMRPSRITVLPPPLWMYTRARVNRGPH